MDWKEGFFTVILGILLLTSWRVLIYDGLTLTDIIVKLPSDFLIQIMIYYILQNYRKKK